MNGRLARSRQGASCRLRRCPDTDAAWYIRDAGRVAGVAALGHVLYDKSSIMKCVAMSDDLRDFARRHLAEPANGWSVGTWGAIGEFQYDAGEPGLAVDLV